MSESTIKDLIEQGEGTHLKLLRDVNLKSIGKAVTAFLNTKGGKIIIGATSTNDAAGVEDTDNVTTEIKTHLSANVFPRDAWSVDTESADGKIYVVVDVPVGASLPYSYNNDIFTERADGQVALATSKEISNLIAEKRAENERWERLPTLGSSISELEIEEIDKTVRLMQDRFIVVPETDETSLVLENLNLIRYGQILNSAFILFGKEPQRRYPQIRVRAARFADDEQWEFVDNRIFEGNSFTLIEQINGFLRANLPVSSSLDEASYQRSDKPTYPPFALREAVMNALVHRDYSSFDGSVSIAIYPDRFEIWNPGSLPNGMSVIDLKTSGISRLRNPDIAHVFFLRGLIERWGIGTKRIFNECIKAGLPEPEWEEIGGGIRLTMWLTTQSSQTSEAMTELNDREIKFLSGVEVGFQIDVKDYQDNYAGGVTERTARRDLLHLLELGYLKIMTRGSRKIYTRTEKLIP